MIEQETRIPVNILIEQHPADTLMNIQSMIAFLQDYTSKMLEEPGIIPNAIKVNSGHHVLLKMIGDALEYEINRMEATTNLAMIN